MRASFIIVALAATVASASSLYPRQATFPTCAMACLGQGDLGGCSLTDNTCLCKNNAACTDPADIKTVTDISIALCRSAGVDISTLTASAAAAASTANHSAHSVTSTAAAAASQSPNAGSVNAVSKGAVFGLVGAAAAALAL